MASRPLIGPFSVITDGDMSGDITSKVTVIQNTTLISYEIAWNGTSPVGVISVEVSNDYSQNQDGTVKNAGKWTELPLSVTPTVSGNIDNGFIDITEIAAYAIRVKYTRTSGTGSLQATLVAKVA